MPGGATLTVDLRNTDDETLAASRAALARRGRPRGDRTSTVSDRSLARFEPVDFDPGIVDLVEATAQRLGLKTRRMPSGAGHDAQMLAEVCPTAMIFVPSVNGLSQNIAEYTAPDDLERGANVLLHVILARGEEYEWDETHDHRCRIHRLLGAPGGLDFIHTHAWTLEATVEVISIMDKVYPVDDPSTKRPPPSSRHGHYFTHEDVGVWKGLQPLVWDREPTVEEIARRIYRSLADKLPGLIEVALVESTEPDRSRTVRSTRCESDKH